MKKPSRILMLTQFYAPLIGGIERHVATLSKELTHRGYQVAVATIWQEGLPETETIDKIDVFRVKGLVHRAASFFFQDSGQVYPPPMPDPELVASIGKVIKAFKPDIIHAHNWLVHNYLPLARRNSTPLVVTLHDYSLCCPKWSLTYQDGSICSGPGFMKCLRCVRPYYGPRGYAIAAASWIMNRIERRKVTAFIAVSQAVVSGNDLRELGNDRCRVIPNFIIDHYPDTLSEEAASITAQLPEKSFILFVGAFSPYKGFPVLLDAYARLDNRNEVPLVMIGYDIPKQTISQSDIPQNSYLFRNWPNEAVMEAWRRCLVGIVPSILPEPCPTVALEAMVMSKPVVASALGGLLDIVEDEVTGFLVSPGDAQALSQRLQQLIDNPQLAAQMGQEGAKRVNHFQAQQVVQEIENVYCNVFQ